MAFRRSRHARIRRERIRALTPAALELSGLLAEIGKEAGASGSAGANGSAGAAAGTAEKRRRAAALARHVIREAEELRWDPRISEEFRAVLLHTRARLEGDPRVQEILRETAPAASP